MFKNLKLIVNLLTTSLLNQNKIQYIGELNLTMLIKTAYSSNPFYLRNNHLHDMTIKYMDQTIPIIQLDMYFRYTVLYAYDLNDFSFTYTVGPIIVVRTYLPLR